MEYNQRMIELGQRIKVARKEKGLSQSAIILLLQDRNDGSSIGRNSFSKWENGQVDNMRSHLKTLYAIGEILNIDINYFIGEQSHKSLDRHDISLYTGLSDAAVENMHALSIDKQSALIISAFFTSPHLKAILSAGGALELAASYANTAINANMDDSNTLMLLEYELNKRKTDLLKWISLFIDDITGYDDLIDDLTELRENADNGKKKKES